jgi:hypothetical protein
MGHKGVALSNKHFLPKPTKKVNKTDRDNDNVYEICTCFQKCLLIMRLRSINVESYMRVMTS